MVAGASSDRQRARVLAGIKARVAPLRPGFRGACGLDAGSAHARPDWLLQTMPGPDPLHVVVDDLFKLTRFSALVDIHATTLEANAAMRSIERWEMGESREVLVRRPAEASAFATPARAELARCDRFQKSKETSNDVWQSPQDPAATVAKMKDGGTRLAHRAEHGVRPRDGCHRRGDGAGRVGG